MKLQRFESHKVMFFRLLLQGLIFEPKKSCIIITCQISFHNSNKTRVHKLKEATNKFRLSVEKGRNNNTKASMNTYTTGQVQGYPQRRQWDKVTPRHNPIEVSGNF